MIRGNTFFLHDQEELEREYNEEFSIHDDSYQLHKTQGSTSNSPSQRKLNSLTLRLTQRVSSTVQQTLDGIANTVAFVVKELQELDEQEGDKESEGTYSQESTGRIFPKGEKAVLHCNLQNYLESYELQRSQHFLKTCHMAQSRLPWEVWVADQDELGSQKGGSFVKDEELKQAQLALSHEESTFSEPFLENNAMVLCDEKDEDITNQISFNLLDEHKPSNSTLLNNSFLLDRAGTIQQLFIEDSNLCIVYDSIVGQSRISEEIFWRNYFFNCEKVRLHLQEKRKSNVNRGSFGKFIQIKKEDLLCIDASKRIPHTLSDGSLVLVCDTDFE